MAELLTDVAKRVGEDALPSEVAQAALDLIEDERRWCRCTLYRDDNNKVARQGDATKCCVLGAIGIALGVNEVRIADDPRFKLIRETWNVVSHGLGMVHVNDALGHPFVVKFLKETIERLKDAGR